MNHKRDVKKLIIRTLRAHPEGLMLTELAGITGMNRFTVTKYIHELKGAGTVHQRLAAAARICYLKESFNEKKDLEVKKDEI